MFLKAFRLFISSTFADFAGEREVLHSAVFPRIERYCLERGYQFHPIDLRWGVSEEAQLDQKTVALCLNAVEASKRYPPPNFLIMLGNRYGWVPLPYAIERGEYEAIKKASILSLFYLAADLQAVLPTEQFGYGIVHQIHLPYSKDTKAVYGHSPFYLRQKTSPGVLQAALPTTLFDFGI